VVLDRDLLRVRHSERGRGGQDALEQSDDNPSEHAGRRGSVALASDGAVGVDHVTLVGQLGAALGLRVPVGAEVDELPTGSAMAPSSSFADRPE